MNLKIRIPKYHNFIYLYAQNAINLSSFYLVQNVINLNIFLHKMLRIKNFC